MTTVFTLRTGPGTRNRARVSLADKGVLLRANPVLILTPEQAMNLADALVDYAEESASSTTADQL